MTSTAEGRVFPEEEPTGKFESETLDALRARSLEKSTMFNATLDGPPPDLVTAPYPAARPPMSPTPSSPEFLGKGAPVLVLPSEPPPPAAPPPAAPPPPVVVAPMPEPAAAVVPAPALDPASALPAPVPAVPAVERSHRRIRARAVARPRRRVLRHVIKLALLALAVLCQPWWWNVGDLSSRPMPPPMTTTAPK